MAHVCPFGAGDVTSAVAAGVSQVTARALRKTWKLMMKKKMMKRQWGGEDKSSCKNHDVKMRDFYL